MDDLQTNEKAARTVAVGWIVTVTVASLSAGWHVIGLVSPLTPSDGEASIKTIGLFYIGPMLTLLLRACIMPMSLFDHIVVWTCFLHIAVFYPVFIRGIP